MAKVFFSMVDLEQAYFSPLGDRDMATQQKIDDKRSPKRAVEGRRLESVTTKDGFVKRVWKGTKKIGGNAKNFAGKGFGDAKDLGGRAVGAIKANPKTSAAVLLGGTVIGAGGAYAASLQK
jgi:hypothetical protein